MKPLIRLYPAWWRRRHHAEMAQLLDELSPMSWRRRLSTGVGLAIGAADAHLSGDPYAMASTRSAMIRAARVAVVVWLALSVEIVLSNVVHPHTADDDGVSVLVSYLAVFGALAFTGRLVARSGLSPRVVAAAGAVAGGLIGALTIGTFAIVDNAFLGIVSQQQAKIDGLAASGTDSIRTYVNTGLLLGFCVLSSFLAVAGAGLALVGALTSERFRAGHARLGEGHGWFSGRVTPGSAGGSRLVQREGHGWFSGRVTPGSAGGSRPARREGHARRGRPVRRVDHRAAAGGRLACWARCPDARLAPRTWASVPLADRRVRHPGTSARHIAGPRPIRDLGDFVRARLSPFLGSLPVRDFGVGPGHAVTRPSPWWTSSAHPT